MAETTRCPWAGNSEPYQAYHDREWGYPARDDRVHFEFLVLEGAQAGLSWITILKKREAYREAFAGFDPVEVARFDAGDVERLLANPGIVRNRRKVEAAVRNARLFLEVREEFGSFDAYLYGFAGGKSVTNRWKTMAEVPARTELSDRISADLKSRGFGFAGSVIVYSHLQAVGVVNDHLVSCFRWKECRDAR